MDPLDGFWAPTSSWFRQRFGVPTPAQEAAFPAIASGEHALIRAPTGSGKTLAAFLVGLDRLLRAPVSRPGVRLLYVSPLKALATDVRLNLLEPLAGITSMAEVMGTPAQPVTVSLRTGDTDSRGRSAFLRTPGTVLVTTPESLYLLLGAPRGREHLRSIQTVIVDEVHALAPNKRGAHLLLSLERLVDLTGRDPVRVGLSATARPLDAMARFLGGGRPVTVVDRSAPRSIEVRIESPVPDLTRPAVPNLGVGGEGPFQRIGGRRRQPDPDVSGDALSHGVWPAIVPRVASAIASCRTTIVFCNSRLTTERLTRRLNELAGDERIAAHHGSLSHERRMVVERALKAGELPAVVATRSLELGIDIGSVDQVVMVESPGSVARGLQRVGRAGHQVGGTSRALFLPRHRLDLLEMVAVSQGMAEGAIEATRVPSGCLDVLAQQIVASVAAEVTAASVLFARARRAATWADLDRSTFDAVLDMLDGRVPTSGSIGLHPRVSWDRATGSRARTAGRGPRRSDFGRDHSRSGHLSRPPRRGRPPSGRARRGDDLRESGRGRRPAWRDGLAHRVDRP